MLTKLKLALLISAPLIAGATTLAIAGDGPGRDAVRAARHAAFKAKRAERKQAMLAKFDKNGDGKLDAGERVAMRDALTTERFQAMDKNGDGVLSLDEFKAGAGKAGLHRHARHG